MLRVFNLLLLTFIFVSPARSQVLPPGALPLSTGNFYGKIIDDSLQKPIEGAFVQLLQNKPDISTKKRKDLNISTQLTNKKGEFNMGDLPVEGNFKLQVSAVGFIKYEANVTFDMQAPGSKPAEINSSLNTAIKDLGNIRLTKDPEQLDNITLSSSVPLMEMYLDKKVYNAEKDLSARGGTAADVLKNIPSVTMDIDGNVTLRNATPLIFVDGRPTSLSPDQIPADQVSAVEIITNPSSKYDAGSGGSGILNIILRKNKREGYNGNLRASIDSRARPVLGADVNIKQNKLNVFAAGQFFSRKNIGEVNTSRTDFFKTDVIHIRQDNDPITKGHFVFGRLGIDYFIDNRNTLTLSAGIVRGKFGVADLLNVQKDTVSPGYIVSESAQRNIKADIRFNNTGASLGFKHNFAKAGHEWTADASYNESINDNTSNYSSRFYDDAGNPTYKSAERAVGGGTTRFYTFQTDLIYPLAKNSRVETGARIAGKDYSSWNDNFIQNPGSSDYLLIDALGVRFNFTDIVYAAYGNYSRQLKAFSYQAGLRVESSSYNGHLASGQQRFSNAFPLSFFPSLFLSKKLGPTQDMQLNYSRKINRPSFFQVLPFVDFSDSLNLTIGNPALQPEFTQLAELNYNNQYKPGFSLFTTLYLKYTGNLITRYQYKAPNTNPAKPDSVIYNSYANATSSYTAGVEITAKNKITAWWDLSSNLNLFDVTLDAGNIALATSDHLFSWFAKLNNNFRLPRNYTVQLSGEYQAKTILPVNSGRAVAATAIGGGIYGTTPNIAQGYIEPFYGADLAIKKDFLKHKAASVTLQFNDIFRTRKYATHTDTGFFTQDNARRRDPQVLRLNFSWRFGRIDAALFKKKNMKADMESLQNLQQGQ